jgi:hypothetical protein
MKQFKKVVAIVGKYTDANGQEKNRYVTAGRAFIRDDNSMSIKLDAIPIGPEFSGWLNLYDLDEDRQGQAPARAAPARAAPAPATADEDLPF